MSYCKQTAPSPPTPPFFFLVSLFFLGGGGYCFCFVFKKGGWGWKEGYSSILGSDSSTKY